MPLDYSKWDNLELSDDSDIECHPNVDKKSMIKWKREAIHRERAERKAQISQLQEFIPMEEWVLHHLNTIRSKDTTAEETLKAIQRWLELATQENKHIVAVAASTKPNTPPLTLGEALGSILKDITPDKEKELKERLDSLHTSATSVLERSEKELERLKKEEGKKLTSENMFHETSNRTILNSSKDQPKPSSSKPKAKEQVIETLNPGVQMKDLSIHDKQQNEADEEDDDKDIELSKEAEAFAKLKGFEPSYKHLMRYPEIINETMSDQILAEAFTQQLKGNEDFSRNCVIQALTLQYCGQLGSNGLNVFFSRMNGPNQQARKMFFDDVDRTYGRIKVRCAEIAAEQNAGVETIQLQAAEDGSPLTIRVPDPNKEEEKEAYKVFEAMPQAFQDALKTGELDNLNKVLEKMSVEDAETLVQVCSEYGFLDVGEQVIDQTK
ncbi:hsp90 co-chaperone cdc37 [Lichtheimia corymbifera JMRC:FSU:9682]|uniref:Hsp90 chaperone protein kinase-targeting subunit n=1 Tax=Lichtheimia corymbifera JMRC:FSU:9682 TaxID=1263082 RepID=A0A068S8T0_9FUNG|nr:hsp90 co-chaperone cdc37 [Lichtheimia corymbifera JMRC:FSU:9682]